MRKPNPDANEQEWPGRLCTQPQCAFRDVECNRTHLAELLLNAVSRVGTAKPVAEEQQIVPRKACVECATRVIRGQRPFLTAEERDRILEELVAHKRDGFIVID